jgi:hypothetical protein
LLVAALSLCAAAARGHHSFAAHFLPDKIVSVSGVVSEFSFHNPHGVLQFRVQGPDGTTQDWKAETNAPTLLRRRGWSADSIKPGDEVTVEGYAARDGSHYLRIYRVIFPDGRELVAQRPTGGLKDPEQD